MLNREASSARSRPDIKASWPLGNPQSWSAGAEPLPYPWIHLRWRPLTWIYTVGMWTCLKSSARAGFC